MTTEELDSVAPDYMQCILGHVRLEKTTEGVYCQQCERTYDVENIVNKRERARRRKNRRQV